MESTLLAEGLNFPECVRWHDGEIWFVDTPYVKVITKDGTVRVHGELPARLVLGLTFGRDGDAFAGDALGRRIYRIDDRGKVELAADLSEHFPNPTNEVVTGPDGSLYVGSWGFAILEGASPAHSKLARVEPSGNVSSVGSDVLFPNGLVVDAAGTSLYVAESFAGCITQFAIRSNGTLSDGTTFADVTSLDANHPDGIALAPGGGVWYADPFHSVVVRVAQGGEELARVTFPVNDSAVAHPTSCAIGGENNELLLVTATDQMANKDFTFSGGAGLFAVTDV